MFPDDPVGGGAAARELLGADLTGTVPSGADSIPLRLGKRYRILALLGSGGMGTVYRARDEELGVDVALKMMRRDLAERPEIMARFRREVTLARLVTHKGVARMFDIGEHGTERFLTMELVDGEALSKRLAKKPLPVAEALGIAGDVCQAIAAAHAAGVIHRDLKPDNVLIAKDGRVVVTDFGIARALSESSSTLGGLGTPAYMAPEQVDGGVIDGRADLYALGAMLFELLTGHWPFEGDSIVAVASARLVQPPPDPRSRRPELPATVAALVLRLLARSPDDRPRTADDAGAAIAAARASLTPGATPTPAPRPAPPLAVPRATERTVAVLPFRNTGEAAHDFLADEITDEVIDALSMSGTLRVRPRSAVRRFGSAEREARDIGAELGVQVVVEGSVRRLDERLRVNARATSVTDGFQLWARRFEQPVTRALEVADEIAGAIAELLATERTSGPRDAPSSQEALELYLQGRREYRALYPPNQARAIAFFERAQALSPDDPTVLAALGCALARQAHWGRVPFERARAVAAAAVARAPSLAEAHLAMAMALRDEHAAAAMRALRPAISLAPGLPEVQLIVGTLLAEAGAEEGLTWLTAALAADPGLPLGHDTVCRIHALRGDVERANAVFDANVAGPERPIGPSTWRHPLWFQDRARAAAAAARVAAFDDPFARMTRGALVILDGGSADVIKTALHDAFAAFEDPFVLLMKTELELVAGRHAEAISLFQRAVEGGLADLAWTDGCPLLAPVRDDGRFVAGRAVVEGRAAEVIAASRAAARSPDG